MFMGQLLFSAPIAQLYAKSGRKDTQPSVPFYDPKGDICAQPSHCEPQALLRVAS